MGCPCVKRDRIPSTKRPCPDFWRPWTNEASKQPCLSSVEIWKNSFNRKMIEAAAAAGHEIANHSYMHDYALSRLAIDDIRNDVRRAHVLIQEISGHAPVGFRAPGYNQSEHPSMSWRGWATNTTPAFSRRPLITQPGHRHWTVPTPKQNQSLARGRHEGVHGAARALLPKAQPALQAGKTSRKRAANSSKFPMSVAGPARLPWLGTSLALAPDRVGRLMTRSVLKQKAPAVLELHAIDFADPQDGFEGALQKSPKRPPSTGQRQTSPARSDL